MNRQDTTPSPTTTAAPPPEHVPGWGADARRENRPGVPEEITPPHPLGAAHWTEPERQTHGVPTVRGVERSITPVYGTANPLRGLSGVVRRAAYRIPDYRTGRWMLLMLADRIDVVEHNPLPIALLAGGVAAGVLTVRALQRR